MKKENQLKNRNIIAKVNFPTQICKWLRENPKNTIFYLVIYTFYHLPIHYTFSDFQIIKD